MALSDKTVESISMPAEVVHFPESIELIGTGTRNVLWLTVREGRRLVLKGLPEFLRSHPEEVARLRKEYSVGFRINHPGVVGVYGFEDNQKVGPVIVMEYIEGISLGEFLKEKKSLSPKLRLRIANEIVDALVYMHSLGLFHRDLKPDNILITRRNEAKIIDVGLGDAEDSAIYKLSMATEQFGAPEQQAPYAGDSSADVYSFGKLLELLLPESRFHKLRNGCLQEDAGKRITMQEAAEYLDHAVKSRMPGLKSLFLIGSAVMVFLLCFVGIAIIGLRPSEKAKKDMLPRVENMAEFKDETFSAAINERLDKKINDESSKRAGSIKEIEVKSAKTHEKQDKVNTNLETVSGVIDYEKIFKKYMAELDGMIKKYGCGFDKKQGVYIDSITEFRSLAAADISSRMVNELAASGCPYEQMTRYGNLMLANMKQAIEKVDGRKLE